MDVKELTELLVSSSEKFNQARFIPWWEDDEEKSDYWDNRFEDSVVEEAEECLAKCGREELLAPVGKVGLNLFHLLVWHNFHASVEKMLCDGRITEAEINLPDQKGHGLTPFLLACARSNLGMVRLLLEHGASDAQCDDRDMNAYHFLAYPRFSDGMLTFDGTCLERSVEQRGEIARLLTCDINGKNIDGLTPLEKLLSTDYSSEYTWPLAKVFLDKGAKTDYVDEDGNTLLMMARRNGHNTAALELMERCPEMVNVANKRGLTPIEHAIEFHNEAMYLALKQHGADPVPKMDLFPLSQITSNFFCKVSRESRDALGLALYLTKMLIRQIDPDDEDEFGEVMDILHNALMSDEEASVLEVCKEEGMDFTNLIYYKSEAFCLRDKCLEVAFGFGVFRKMVEWGVDMEKAVVKGRTPANLLASNSQGCIGGEKENYLEKAAAFFSKESMEQRDNDGRAAVHRAAENGHLGMLKIMLEKGVDVNLTQDEPGEAGVTPLHLACMEGCQEVVELLVNAGADDTMKTLKGSTPAHCALMEKGYSWDVKTEPMAAILKTLKHLDIPDEEGRTPLMLLRYHTRELLPLFLDRGVDVNHVDQEGRTALMFQWHKEMAKELLGAGADINKVDKEGNTALHYALEAGGQEDARYLIRKGADYNHPNNQGVTPAQMAAEQGFEAVLDLMTEIR